MLLINVVYYQPKHTVPLGLSSFLPFPLSLCAQPTLLTPSTLWDISDKNTERLRKDSQLVCYPTLINSSSVEHRTSLLVCNPHVSNVYSSSYQTLTLWEEYRASKRDVAQETEGN